MGALAQGRKAAAGGRNALTTVVEGRKASLPLSLGEWRRKKARR